MKERGYIILAENSIAYAQRSFCVGPDTFLSFATVVSSISLVLILEFPSTFMWDAGKIARSDDVSLWFIADGKLLKVLRASWNDSYNDKSIISTQTLYKAESYY